MKKILAAMVLAGGLVGPVHAYTVTSGGTVVSGEGQVSSVLGAVTTDFNSGSLPGNYSGGDVKLGSQTNDWATPPGDTSYYYSVGPSTSTPGTATFASPLSYFGFYWGSPDTYNNLELLSGTSVLKSWTGTQLASLMSVSNNGNQSVGVFVNILADNAAEYFDAVRFTSTTNAFETDNHATIAAIPEPETYALMGLGLGLLGFVARRRKQKAANPVQQ